MGRLSRILKPEQGLSRRGFLLAAGAAGLVMGFTAPGFTPSAAAATPGAGLEPTIWCAVSPTGEVTVNIIRAEMGQHIGTALARILADEMEADWDKVRIRYVDSDPKWGLMVTGGSWSVWLSWDVLRQAGAATRIALVEAAAKLLGTTPEACTARNGVVSAGDRSLTYGEIAAAGLPARAFTPEELQALPLKPATEHRLVGTSVQALDVPSKTDGTALYGIDARVEGMVHARPVMPPTRYGSKVRSVDDSAARRLPGYQRHLVIEDPSGIVQGWVLAVADKAHTAIRAADLIKVEWDAGPTAKVSEADILARADSLIASPEGGVHLYDDAGVGDTLAKAGERLEQRYTCATVLHYQLEPVNALALRNQEGVYELHAGNQWQSLIIPSLAQALDVPEAKIVLKPYLLGGGFGRRLNGDYLIPAALACKALGGKPVKLILTRADDILFDSLRSPSVQKISAALDKGRGTIAAMDYQVSAGWPTEVMAAVAMAKGIGDKPYDQFAVAGADHWYDVGPFRLRTLSNDLAKATFRPGWLRSVSPGWTSWALESFIDEAAHRLGVDAVEFRLRMLNASGRNAGSAPDSVGGASRLARVIRRAAEKGGWGGPLPPDTGLGLAATAGQERAMPTWSACVARVHVDRKTGRVRCEQLDIVVDAGIVVDPDGALAQTEGAALWGLSMALHEGSRIEAGAPRDRNLQTYSPLRMADVPRMNIEFLPSTEKPMGLGEPGTTIVAPAIGNAIFNAVGARMRHLPIRPEDVLRALSGPVLAAR